MRIHIFAYQRVREKRRVEKLVIAVCVCVGDGIILLGDLAEGQESRNWCVQPTYTATYIYIFSKKKEKKEYINTRNYYNGAVSIMVW